MRTPEPNLKSLEVMEEDRSKGPGGSSSAAIGLRCSQSALPFIHGAPYRVVHHDRDTARLEACIALPTSMSACENRASKSDSHPISQLLIPMLDGRSRRPPKIRKGNPAQMANCDGNNLAEINGSKG